MSEGHSTTFKPTDLFLGVVDVFAILLPGAVLAYLIESWLLYDPARRPIVRQLPSDGIEGWVCFGIISYILGHALHYLGGLVFDPFYDGVYKHWKRFRLRADARARYRAKLMARQILHESFREGDNILTWALVCLRLSSHSAVAELDRMEADSKFFRSLATALILGWPMLFAFFSSGAGIWLVWAELLVLPALWSFSRSRKYEGGELRTRRDEIVRALKAGKNAGPSFKLIGSWRWLWKQLRESFTVAVNPAMVQSAPEPGQSLTPEEEDLYVYAEARASHEFATQFVRSAWCLFAVWLAFISLSIYLWSDGHAFVVSLIVVLITIFAVLRYMKLRLDRTTRSYEFFIAQYSLNFRSIEETG